MAEKKRKHTVEASVYWGPGGKIQWSPVHESDEPHQPRKRGRPPKNRQEVDSRCGASAGAAITRGGQGGGGGDKRPRAVERKTKRKGLRVLAEGMRVEVLYNVDGAKKWCPGKIVKFDETEQKWEYQAEEDNDSQFFPSNALSTKRHQIRLPFVGNKGSKKRAEPKDRKFTNNRRITKGWRDRFCTG